MRWHNVKDGARLGAFIGNAGMATESSKRVSGCVPGAIGHLGYRFIIPPLSLQPALANCFPDEAGQCPFFLFGFTISSSALLKSTRRAGANANADAAGSV